jgi:hypothetical protein
MNDVQKALQQGIYTVGFITFVVLPTFVGYLISIS